MSLKRSIKRGILKGMGKSYVALTKQMQRAVKAPKAHNDGMVDNRRDPVVDPVVGMDRAGG